MLIRFDAELRFTLDAPERRTGINAASQKGQLCVLPSIDGPHRSFSPADLYPDMLPSGVFAARLDGNVLVVRLKGDAEIDVTSYAADPEFQACVAAGAPVLVSMCDADFEPLVIDGGDAGPYPAGNLVPPSAAAAGAPAAARKPAGTKRAAGKKSGSTVDPLASALELVLTAEAELPSLVTRLLKSGEAADYQVERALEGITTALSEHSGTIEASLAKRGSSMQELGAALREVWLEGEVPSCGNEVKVRAAEALGAWSIATGESREAIVRRIGAKRFEHRMWTARAIRASAWPDGATLLAKLRDDSFVDDDGFYLVREAAGFHDD